MRVSDLCGSEQKIIDEIIGRSHKIVWSRDTAGRFTGDVACVACHAETGGPISELVVGHADTDVHTDRIVRVSAEPTLTPAQQQHAEWLRWQHTTQRDDPDNACSVCAGDGNCEFCCQTGLRRAAIDLDHRGMRRAIRAMKAGAR